MSIPDWLGDMDVTTLSLSLSLSLPPSPSLSLYLSHCQPNQLPQQPRHAGNVLRMLDAIWDLDRQSIGLQIEEWNVET